MARQPLGHPKAALIQYQFQDSAILAETTGVARLESWELLSWVCGKSTSRKVSGGLINA